MDQIAREANTSKQTIYSHFSTKSALLAAVLASRFQQRAAPQLIDAKERELDPAQYLEQLGMLLLRSNIAPEARQLSEMLRTVLNHSPEMAETFWNNGPGRGRQFLRAYLQEQNRQGTLCIPDVEIAMEQFLGMVIGGAVFRLSRGMPPLFGESGDDKRWVTACVELFLSFYKA